MDKILKKIFLKIIKDIPECDVNSYLEFGISLSKLNHDKHKEEIENAISLIDGVHHRSVIKKIIKTGVHIGQYKKDIRPILKDILRCL